MHNTLEINYIYQYLTFYLAMDSTSFLNCSKNKFIPPSCLELYFTIHVYQLILYLSALQFSWKRHIGDGVKVQELAQFC